MCVPGVAANVVVVLVKHNQKQVVGTIVSEWGIEVKSVPTHLEDMVA